MSKNRDSGILGNRALRERIFGKYKNRCCNCGTSEGLRIDHIVGVLNGGNDIETNLCVLCYECHDKKHILEKTSEEFSRRIKEGKARSIKPDGRPRNVPENYKKLLDDFVHCRISREQLAKRWGLPTRNRKGEVVPVNFVHLSEQVWYREYLAKLGIEKVVNKVGHPTRDFYNKGIIGYIVYKSGKKEYIYNRLEVEA